MEFYCQLPSNTLYVYLTQKNPGIESLELKGFWLLLDK